MARIKTIFLVALSFFLFASGYRLLVVQPAHAQAGATPEVAVLAGVLNDGETIPLPTYGDGTQALESECKWTVSPEFLSEVGPDGPINAERCNTEGRVVHVHWCVGDCQGEDCEPYQGCGYHPFRGTANYIIIATRTTPLPTPAKQESWGSVKTRYK